MKYKPFDELKEKLLYKRIVAYSENYIELEDGLVLSIEFSEDDRCATCEGSFEQVKLDAAITDVKRINYRESVDEEDSNINYASATLVIYHNQNTIAQANCNVDNGNGYYYNICSVVLKGIHYKVCESKNTRG